MNAKTVELWPFFKAARIQVAKRREAYEQNSAECYRQGYRPSHCIHGTYMWRDYDVICPGCEGPYISDLEQAYIWAKETHAYYQKEAKRAVNTLKALLELGLDTSDEVREHLGTAAKQVRKELDDLYKELTTP